MPLSAVRPRKEHDEVGYQAVAAPKRKRVEDEPIVTEIPKWLAIKETDDFKVGCVCVPPPSLPAPHRCCCEASV